MYRFMEVVSERSNYRTLYRFITTSDDNGNITLLGADTEEELAETVEDLLSNGYSKSTLVAVQVIDYSIITIDYDNDNCCNCVAATEDDVQQVVDSVLNTGGDSDSNTDNDKCTCESATDAEVLEVVNSVLNT